MNEIQHQVVLAGLKKAEKIASPVLSALFGEPSKEVGQLWKDKVSKRRYFNLIKTVAEAKKHLDAAGVSPKEVPLSILHPMLENCSLQEDSDLQSRWAALIANAASPSSGDVIPAFSEILKQITPLEARILTWIFEKKLLSGKSGQGLKPGFPLKLGTLQVVASFYSHHEKGIGIELIQFALDNLCRLGLLSRARQLRESFPRKFRSKAFDTSVMARFLEDMQYEDHFYLQSQSTKPAAFHEARARFFMAVH